MKAQNLGVRDKLEDRIPMLLSKLWVFLSLNYILCDLLSNMETAVIRGLVEGNIAGIPITSGFLLFAAISLEISFLMVILSAVLPYKVNRAVNAGVASLLILYQVASFFVGSALSLHYLFFSSLEIAGNMAVLALSARWKR